MPTEFFALLIDPGAHGLRHPARTAYNARIETPVTLQAAAAAAPTASDGPDPAGQPLVRRPRTRTQRCVAALLLATLLGGFAFSPDADPRLHGAALAAALLSRSDLAVRDGTLRWAEHAVRWGIPGAYLVLDTDAGLVEIAWSLADPAFDAPLAALAALQAAAPSSGTRAARLRFEPLLGATVLETRGGFVHEGRSWQRDASGPLRDAARAHAERAHAELREARAELDAWIESSELGEPGRAALRDTLARLDLRDAEAKGYPAPSALRRMLRHGWLDRLTRGDPRAARLREAVERASVLQPLERTRAGEAAIEQLEDAFGHTARTLRSAAATRYEVALEDPAYFAEAPDTTLVVDLPAGADPLAAAPRPLAARVFQDRVPIASWDEAEGFRGWPERWQRRAIPPAEERDGWVLRDAIPAHVRITSARGDVQRLITAYGALEPERASSSEAREAWLNAAARALPDAAHLDLLGEFLFAYAHDSPEPHWPELLGTPQRLGDIHQTTAQTLATEAGGMYRGDCDDLSELYQEIAKRQGRNAHLIGLPAHAALAWAEPDADGSWRTYVLQTAPPLAVRGDTLEKSLEETYRSFDAEAPLHADQLEVLLRFAGDNTRDTYYLSSRIFADSAYARRMIDLQENWHGWTLGRGLRLAESEAARPGAAVAELLELGSLLERTGQLAASAAVLGRALAQSRGGAERAELAIQQVEVLFDAGQADAARRVVGQLLDTWIPELERGEDALELTLRTRLADALLTRGRDRAAGLEILAQRIAPVLARRRHWYRSSEERYRIEEFMELAVSALHDTSQTALSHGDDWRALSKLAGEWLAGPAFVALQASESVLKAYGLLGRYLEAVEGVERYRVLARAAAPPTSAERDHAAVVRRPGQVRIDAGWVGVSPHYWWSALLDLVAFDRRTLARRDALELAMQLRVARVRAEELGLGHASFAGYLLQSEIATALAANDLPRLRSALAGARESGDWERGKTAAFWVEEIGRRLPLERFESAMDGAIVELRSRPLLLQIAWRAMRAGATQHALAAAQAAARASPKDAILAEEYAFMRQLAAARASRPRVEGRAEPIF